MGIPCSSSTRHVMSRNYSGAPRFCPGYHLSMKVAKEVCAQFTKVQRSAAGPTKSVFLGPKNLLGWLGCATICRRAVILRFCWKSYFLSLQCLLASQDLNQWGGFQRDHKKIEGLVKIKPLGFAVLLSESMAKNGSIMFHLRSEYADSLNGSNLLAIYPLVI